MREPVRRRRTGGVTPTLAPRHDTGILRERCWRYRAWRTQLAAFPSSMWAPSTTAVPAEPRASPMRSGAPVARSASSTRAGHKVSPALVADGFAAAQKLFALPAAQKMRVSITRSPHNRGYVGLLGEALDPSKPPDLKEAFNIGLDLAADDPAGLGRPAFPRRQPVAGARRVPRRHAGLLRRGVDAGPAAASRLRARSRPARGLFRGQARSADGHPAPAALSAQRRLPPLPASSARASIPTTATSRCSPPTRRRARGAHPPRRLDRGADPSRARSCATSATA